MARQGRGHGPQRPIKGFRPGKEPPQLRKRRAKETFGEVNAAQERLIEMFAERSPEEARGLVRRWKIGLLVGGIALAIIGAFLYGWSVIAGVIVHVLAVVGLVVWWRLHRQSEALEAMADAVHGSTGRKRRK